MRKISLLLAAVGGAALVSAAAVQGVAASAGPGPATVLKFATMTPVTGPYVGTANPVRGVPGGGLLWILTAGSGSLKRDGHLLVRVRGLVLANQAPVPPALQGTNPFPDFRALVSCQSIGAGNTATVTNISTVSHADQLFRPPARSDPGRAHTKRASERDAVQRPPLRIRWHPGRAGRREGRASRGGACAAGRVACPAG